MKTIITPILVAIFAFLPLSASAAPTRDSSPSELFFSFEQPQSLGAHAFVDKFFAVGGDSVTNGRVYTLNYTSEDPVTIVALSGARISTFTRSNAGKQIQVTFTYPGTIPGSDNAIYLTLFPASLSPDPANAQGFSTALTGAWFDSRLGRMATKPFFTDEHYKRIIWSFTSLVSGSDDLRAFLPQSALNFLVKRNTLPASKVALRTEESDVFENAFGTGSALGDGVLFSNAHTFAAVSSTAFQEISKLRATGFYGQSTATKNTDFPLTVFVKDCKANQIVKVQKSVGDTGKFRSAGRLPLSTCEASFATSVAKKTRFRFQIGETIYELLVKAVKAQTI